MSTEALSRLPEQDGFVYATVEKILDGVNGKYAVTHPSKAGAEYGTITFALSAWDGDREPQPGQVVKLFGVELFERGWRATEARRIPFVGSAKKR